MTSEAVEYAMKRPIERALEDLDMAADDERYAIPCHLDGEEAAAVLKELKAGRKLWAHIVKTRQAWGEDQDAYVEMGLLAPVDMRGVDEAEQCSDCDGDCRTCYQTTELLR